MYYCKESYCFNHQELSLTYFYILFSKYCITSVDVKRCNFCIALFTLRRDIERERNEWYGKVKERVQKLPFFLWITNKPEVKWPNIPAKEIVLYPLSKHLSNEFLFPLTLISSCFCIVCSEYFVFINIVAVSKYF